MIQPPSNWPISGAINRLLTCCLLAACLAAPNAVNGDLITVNSVTDTHEIVDAVNPGNSVSGTGNTITGNMGSHSAGGFSTSYSSEYSNTPFSTPRHTTPHIGENVDAHFAIKYDFDLAHTASIGPDSYARARNEVTFTANEDLNAEFLGFIYGFGDATNDEVADDYNFVQYFEVFETANPTVRSWAERGYQDAMLFENGNTGFTTFEEGKQYTLNTYVRMDHTAIDSNFNGGIRTLEGEFYMRFATAPVPEPSSLTCIAALFGYAGLRRRRRS